MKYNPDIKLLAKGIMMGLGSTLLTGVLGVAVSVIGASLTENHTSYTLVVDVSIGISVFYLLSLVAVGMWVGLKARQRGWLWGGITTFVLWSVQLAISVVGDGLPESGALFALGVCLVGLSVLGSCIGNLVRKRQDLCSR